MSTTVDAFGRTPDPERDYYANQAREMAETLLGAWPIRAHHRAIEDALAKAIDSIDGEPYAALAASMGFLPDYKAWRESQADEAKAAEADRVLDARKDGDA